MDNAITRVDAQQTDLAAPAPSIEMLMEKVVNRENPQDMAGALEQLVKLKEHVEDRNARQEFFQAFARVQAKLQTVVATMAVPDKSGNIRWFVAPFADIMDAIEPVLRDEGFSVRFDSERNGTVLTGYCYAMHTAGHQESARCHINPSNAQGGDLGALTTAKRGALMEMFALKVRRSDDARLLGDFISARDAEELNALIAAAAPVDMAKFLRFAGAEKITDIRSGKLPALRAYLKKKAASGPNNAQAEDVAKSPARTSSATDCWTLLWERIPDKTEARMVAVWKGLLDGRAQKILTPQDWGQVFDRIESMF